MTEQTSSARCQSCRRKLTAASSVTPGRGPVCSAKVRKAAQTIDLTGFHRLQVDKARELIEQQAIIPSSRPGMYAAVSGDGPTGATIADWPRGGNCTPARCPRPRKVDATPIAFTLGGRPALGFRNLHIHLDAMPTPEQAAVIRQALEGTHQP
jgi:Family of unknown function (DUF6011)